VSERRVPDWLPRAGVAVALCGLVVWSFAQRWTVLAGSPFPLGVDGYFYPVQLRSLLETGHLQYAASPLPFWVLAPFAAATDPIVGTKLGAACLGALLALPAYAVGARLGRSQGAGLVTAALATCSAGSAYLTIEFVKNSIGITVAMTALWLVLRALEVPSRTRIAGALGGIVAAMLAHKMAAGLVIAIAIPASLAELAGRSWLRGRRLLYALGCAGLLAMIVIVLGLVAPHRFLSPDDAHLLGELWTTAPSWSLPVLDSGRGVLRLGDEPLAALVLALLAAIALVVERQLPRATRSRIQPASRSVQVTSWAVVGLGLVIGLPWLAVDDPQGLGMRLRIASFVPMALCAASVLRVVLRAVAPSVAGAICVMIALAATVHVPGSRTEGLVPTHPALVTAVQALADQIPNGDTVVVPERHIAFMVAWYTRAKISLRPEPVPIPERWRLVPLAWIGMGSPLDQALLEVRANPQLPRPIGLHPRHPNGLVLVPEVTWQYVLTRLPADARAYFAAWPTI